MAELDFLLCSSRGKAFQIPFYAYNCTLYAVSKGLVVKVCSDFRTVSGDAVFVVLTEKMIKIYNLKPIYLLLQTKNGNRVENHTHNHPDRCVSKISTSSKKKMSLFLSNKVCLKRVSASVSGNIRSAKLPYGVVVY